MEFERNKMIYTTKVNEEIQYKIDDYTFNFSSDDPDVMGSEKLRILGHNFIENNKNKAKIIFNNKKYKLEELKYLNSSKFKSDEIKLNLIVIKELSNYSHMFKNCFKLKGFFIYTNEINEFDKEFEEYSHYSEENNEDNNSIVYRDLKDIDIYYNSTRSQRTENDEYVDNLTLLYFNENICECKYKYFYNLNQMFFNCYSLFD